MFILYFDSAFHERYHSAVYSGWTNYNNFRAGEGFWLVPGTDPEDSDYCRFDDEAAALDGIIKDDGPGAA